MPKETLPANVAACHCSRLTLSGWEQRQTAVAAVWKELVVVKTGRRLRVFPLQRLVLFWLFLLLCK